MCNVHIFPSAWIIIIRYCYLTLSTISLNCQSFWPKSRNAGIWNSSKLRYWQKIFLYFLIILIYLQAIFWEILNNYHIGNNCRISEKYFLILLKNGQNWIKQAVSTVYIRFVMRWAAHNKETIWIFADNLCIIFIWAFQRSFGFRPDLFQSWFLMSWIQISEKPKLWSFERPLVNHFQPNPQKINLFPLITLFFSSFPFSFSF